MHYKKLWLALGICYIAFIIVGSLIKVPDIETGMSHSDKVIHFFLYFILVGWFIQLYKKLSTRIIILCAALALGLLMETLQGLTAYRSFDLIDQLANSIGALSAFLLAATRFNSLLSSIDCWIYQTKIRLTSP